MIPGLTDFKGPTHFVCYRRSSITVFSHFLAPLDSVWSTPPLYMVGYCQPGWIRTDRVNQDSGLKPGDTDKMSLPAQARRPNSSPLTQSTPVTGMLLWITVNRGELRQTGWIGRGRGNGDNPKDKQNISPDTWKKGCPDSPHLAQFTPAVPIHPHGQYIQ